MPGPLKKLPAGTSAADFDASGALGLPGAVAGVTHKVGRAVTNPETLEMLGKLLGVPLQVTKGAPSKRGFLQLSSVDPQAGLARLFSLDAAGEPLERVAMQLVDLVKSLKTGLLSEVEGFDAHKLLTQRFDDVDRAAGERIAPLTQLGPRGGTVTKRRAVPTVATR